MPKRNSEGDVAEKYATEEQGSRLGKKFKHTLESDEEDDEEMGEQYNVLDPDDLEGQEDATIERDGEIQITPFNMKEELEDGHIDKQGMYIFKKDKDDIRDHWLDNIDWVKIKDDVKPGQSEMDSEDAPEKDIDVTEVYKQMVELMKPGETVQKAIRRLGGNKTTHSASSRWKKKKEAEKQESEADDSNKEKLLQLSGLADQIIQTGNMDAYELTYEKISFFLPKSSKSEPEKIVDPSQDMFGDAFDVEATGNPKASEAATEENETVEPASNEVQWEYKWENTDESEVYGPYGNSEMLRWTEEGYFKDGVWVRRTSQQDAPFYSSERIDFELYS